jgi:hypothetical protein
MVIAKLERKIAKLEAELAAVRAEGATTYRDAIEELEHELQSAAWHREACAKGWQHTNGPPPILLALNPSATSFLRSVVRRARGAP